MSKIIVFNMVTVDGYFAGPKGEIDWHNTDDEFQEFAIEHTKEFGTLFFGRVTYEMMASFWPTPYAIEVDPIVAGIMNTTPKIVFSKTLKEVKETKVWKNVKLFREIRPAEIRKLKKESIRDIAIFGSGEIVQEFTILGLIDEYRLMVNPVILGKGKPLFSSKGGSVSGGKNVNAMLKLKLLTTRTFKNGNVLLNYEPVY